MLILKNTIILRDLKRRYKDDLNYLFIFSFLLEWEKKATEKDLLPFMIFQTK